jgi:proteasome accessory factor B
MERLSRSVRLIRLQQLLHHYPGGLTSYDLARLLGYHIRTIQRDLLMLQSELHLPVTKEGRRYRIAGRYLLPPLSFSLNEAVALLLAARLLYRQTDEHNPHAYSALEKLAQALPHPVARQLQLTLEDLSARASHPEFVGVLEAVTFAWATQRRLRITYLALGKEVPRIWELEPYLLEVTGIGFSSYVVGKAYGPSFQGILTFKMERIQKAEVLEERFEIDPAFEPRAFFAGSWGIIGGEEVEVKLRFSPSVTRRVKESIWHPSQKVEELPEGGCILSLKVASLLEITPWIRSWGPDVEVLAPEALRLQFKEWARRMTELYGG